MCYTKIRQYSYKYDKFCMCVCVNTCLSNHLSLCMFVYPFVYSLILLVLVSVCLFFGSLVYLFMHLFVPLCTCATLFVSIFMCVHIFPCILYGFQCVPICVHLSYKKEALECYTSFLFKFALPEPTSRLNPSFWVE